MVHPLLIILAYAIGWLVSEGMIRAAARLALIQHPNHRSSHSTPTPHGGGIGIILGSLAALIPLALADINGMSLWPLLLPALALAVVGLCDDKWELSARLRLGAQVTACAALLWWVPPISAFGPLWLWWPLVLLAGIWWVNLFNFMDGIDGLAASQGIFMLTTAALLAHSAAPASLWGMLALAAASLGFLQVNWPPARIFMGDVGSTYLGFMIFGLALLSIREGWMSYPAWIILGALFVTDASLTLLRRIAQGERWLEAHRSHAYQRLSRRWQSHRNVTLLAITVNMLWLAPLAYASLQYPQLGWILCVLAYLPLIAAAWASGAGRNEN